MSNKCETPPGREGFAGISVDAGYTRTYAPKCRTPQAEICAKSQLTDWDLAALSDRRFFERFQDRQFYVRPACASECERLSLDGLKPPPPGTAWFAVVKRGRRMARAWFLSPEENIKIETDEAFSHEIWDGLGVMAGDAWRDA